MECLQKYSENTTSDFWHDLVPSKGLGHSLHLKLKAVTMEVKIEAFFVVVVFGFSQLLSTANTYVLVKYHLLGPEQNKLQVIKQCSLHYIVH